MQIQYITLGLNIPIIDICIVMLKISINLKSQFLHHVDIGYSVRVQSFVLQSLKFAETRVFLTKGEWEEQFPPTVKYLLILPIYLENPGNCSPEKNMNFEKE